VRSQLAELNVLTLTEPWASLVVDGQKRFETRYWPTRYRGLLLIQAAKGFPTGARALCYEEPFKSALLAPL
jgi:activating signal cointegrator 1